MRHYRTAKDNGDHYACNHNDIGQVLVQLQQVYQSGSADQVRIGLTPDEARHFAQLILEAAERAENADPDR